jgi:hypothetical protein
MCCLWKQKLNNAFNDNYDNSDNKVVNAADFIMTTDFVNISNSDSGQIQTSSLKNTRIKNIKFSKFTGSYVGSEFLTTVDMNLLGRLFLASCWFLTWVTLQSWRW